MFEKLLIVLLPKLLDFLQSEQFQQLLTQVIKGLEKMLQDALDGD